MSRKQTITRTEVTDWNQLPVVLEAREVAAVMGVDHEAVYAMARTPGFPAIWVSKRRVIIGRDALANWLNNGGRLSEEHATTA